MLHYSGVNNVTIRMVFLFPGAMKIDLQGSGLGTYSPTTAVKFLIKWKEIGKSDQKGGHGKESRGQSNVALRSRT